VNILVVSPWPLSHTGGVTSAVSMLSREFAKKGHTATVLVTDGANRPTLLEERHGVPVYGMYLRVPCSDRAPLRAIVSFFIMLPVTLCRLHRFLARHRIQGIVVQYPLAPSFYFALLRWLNSWKLVVVYQGSDAHELHQWRPIERRLVVRLLAAADCVIAVSRTLLEKVSHVFPGLRLKRSCLIPNGAPLDLLDRLQTAPASGTLPVSYVLTAGRLIHRKGIDVLIEAVRQVRQKGTDLELVVAGDGPERNNLQELATRAGVSAHIRFLGDQSQEQVLQLMKHCLFFVLASRAEGLPLVIAEAMACEKAVIATNVDGVPDIVEHARTGLLVQPEDPQSLADALIKLHENAVWRQDLAKAAREWAIVQFSWESIADRYLRCLMCQEVS